MTKEKIAGALGLCRRAGKITAGTYLVKEEIRCGRAALVLIASDAGADAREKLSRLAAHKGISVRETPLTKSEMAQAIGKSGEAVCASVPKEFLNLVLASL
jgi:ribosomal protein L7Ae-like RNA K-turn-binding protein